MEVNVVSPAPKHPAFNFAPSYPTVAALPHSKALIWNQRCWSEVVWCFRDVLSEPGEETNPSLPTAVGHRCAEACPFPETCCACVRTMLLGSFGLACVSTAKRNLSTCRIPGESQRADSGETL